jgi:hypothetical protein
VVLVLVAVLAFTVTATLPSGAPLARPPADVSRAATFVGFRDGETLFVERVRDAPGGFHGEVSVTPGSVWIRYRVELGPDESIRRYELDMSPRGKEGPKGIPRPLLIARRTPDSVLVEPAPESGFPGRRELVPPGAFIGSTEMAMFEQAIRFSLRWNAAGVGIQIVSAWTGKRLVATVDRRGEKVWLSTTMDSWEFTLDKQNRIVSGTRIRGPQGHAVDPWQGIRVVRLDPSGPNPIHRPLTIGESEEGRRRDRRDSRMQAWARQESTFRATLDSELPHHELTAALDRQILAFASHGGIYQAERCLEAVAALRSRPGGDALAERLARRAVASADAHNIRSFGERGMIEARVKSRMVLAEVLDGLGRRDSAIVLLEATEALPGKYGPLGLRRDVLIQLGNVLVAEGRTDEAIGTLFEAVAVDETSPGIAEPLERSLKDLWAREFPADTTLASRVGRAQRLNTRIFTMGGSYKEPRGAAAPLWSALDLRGRRHNWRAGRPLVVVFWGGWSEPGRRMVRLAEAWYRQRAATGVDVVTFDWELPGRGPVSERLARRAVDSENLTVPVLLDHDREIWSRFHGEGFPQVCFVDREGRIARIDFGGAWRADGLTALVEALGRWELH